MQIGRGQTVNYQSIYTHIKTSFPNGFH